MSFPLFSLRRLAALALVSASLILGIAAVAADSEAGRKIKNKVAPAYPEIAKRMGVSGSVKLEVLVASNGSVKSVKPLGGHPLLIDAATSAVKQWKFEPGEESTQMVEIHFNAAQ